MFFTCSEMPGHKFNKFYCGTKFYKFLNDDLVHHGFKFKLGLNVDHVPFNPNTCTSGGLYFCEESKCHMYFSAYGKKLGRVTIPDDARVYVEDNKFKADKLILESITDFADVPDSFWTTIVELNSNALRYVRDQTEQLCCLAVKQNPLSLQFVKEQTDAVCRLALHKNGLVLHYVKQPLLTTELCKIAVQQNGYALHIIYDSHLAIEEVCRLAVKQNGLALRYVKNQTEEVCRLAVMQNGLALQYVNVKNRTDELCRLAVAQNSAAAVYINNVYDAQPDEILTIPQLKLQSLITPKIEPHLHPYYQFQIGSTITQSDTLQSTSTSTSTSTSISTSPSLSTLTSGQSIRSRRGGLR